MRQNLFDMSKGKELASVMVWFFKRLFQTGNLGNNLAEVSGHLFQYPLYCLWLCGYGHWDYQMELKMVFSQIDIINQSINQSINHFIILTCRPRPWWVTYLLYLLYLPILEALTFILCGIDISILPICVVDVLLSYSGVKKNWHINTYTNWDFASQKYGL